MATTEPQKWTATLGSTADVNALPATTPSGSGRASTSGLFPPVTQLPLDQGGMFSYTTNYDYTAGNLVMHGGSLYLCIASNGPGSAIKYPTDTAYWRQLALTSQLPTVNNGVLTIQKDGATVATFTANQAGNTIANITVSGEDSSGYGWVRFKNGVQICGQECSAHTKDFIVNFPVAFTSVWSVTITNIGNSADAHVYGKVDDVGTSIFAIRTNASSTAWYWIAIGTWK